MIIMISIMISIMIISFVVLLFIRISMIITNDVITTSSIHIILVSYRDDIISY